MRKTFFTGRRHRRIGRAAWVGGAVWLSMVVATVTARQSAPPAQPFRDCPTCPEMVTIPGGAFLMGSPDTEPGRFDTEGPQRRVTIRPFAAGKYDVTRGQWAAFVAATQRETVTGCAFTGRVENRFDQAGSWQNVGFPQDDTHPVVCVTWDDAQAYVRWLSQQTGQRYRLLTEAEWEYAARAGTTTPFPWGTETTHDNANYGADDHFNGLAQGRDRWVNTSPVGAFPANTFGLHDMHGNVLQWVQDCYASYAGLPTDGAAYDTAVALKEGAFPWMVGTNACAYRMLRGGDWGNASRMIRSAFRNFAPPRNATLERYRSGGVGFRVARSVDTAGAQSNSVEAGILASIHQWAEARVKGDTAFLERFYATELRIGQMNGALIHRDDDIALFAARRIKPEYIRNTDLRVAVYGDTAVVSGIESLKGTYDGRPGEMALRILNVLVRRDGRWQLAASQSALIS